MPSLQDALRTFIASLEETLPTNSADERIVNNLVARALAGSKTQKLSASKAEKAILAYLETREHEMVLTDMASASAFRLIPFKDLLKAARSLDKSGKVKFDGIRIKKVVDK